MILNKILEEDFENILKSNKFNEEDIIKQKNIYCLFALYIFKL